MLARLLAYLRALLASYTATLPDEALLEAAEAGKLEGVLEALQLGADISAETADGWTALHFAAAQGRVDVARALLDAGANVSADTTSVRRTPLHWAARNGRTETVHLLLRRGAQTASRDTEGSAPLHLAAARAEGNAEVARLLLEVGADVAAKRKGGFTPLHLSSRVGNVHVTALLLERGADVSCATADGWTPLHGAAVEGELGTVRLLLERGADPSATTNAGRTPLEIARDDATKIVMRITQASQAAASASAAAGGAAAAPGYLSVPVDVAAWFQAQAVDASFAAALGCESLRDVTLLKENDLREVGLKPAQRRRIMAAAAELPEASPAAKAATPDSAGDAEAAE